MCYMKNNFSFFQNTECEYFPCHNFSSDYFNCIFCYCPLYALGDKCGGNFKYTDNNIKDCSSCLIPHTENGYKYIMSKLGDVIESAKKDNEP